MVLGVERPGCSRAFASSPYLHRPVEGPFESYYSNPDLLIRINDTHPYKSHEEQGNDPRHSSNRRGGSVPEISKKLDHETSMLVLRAFTSESLSELLKQLLGNTSCVSLSQIAS